MLQQWLSKIRIVWPECPAKISPDGRHLSVAPVKAIQQNRKQRMVQGEQPEYGPSLSRFSEHQVLPFELDDDFLELVRNKIADRLNHDQSTPKTTEL